MAVTAPVQLPEKLGRYRIIKPLGQGGMGAVYLAHDSELDRSVALKVPRVAAEDSSQVVERFYREAKAAATLRHPNICPVFDIGEFQGTPFLTMAFIEGKVLSDYARIKPLTPVQAATLVRKLALALQEAHQHGVIHRDLKPGNVMIDRRGEPIVMDFGLARRTSHGDARLTQSGAIIGTPAYMPPEQISATVDTMGPGCDIYSLGVILYELLTGRLPFAGDAMAMLAKILTDVPPRPTSLRPEIDPELEAICLQAMAKKPEERYASMAELASDLLTYLRAKSARPQPPQTPRPMAADTQASGLRMSQLGGLRSQAQAALQAGERSPAFAATPTRSRNARRRRLSPWLWATVAGGVIALVAAIVWGLGTLAYESANPIPPEPSAVAQNTLASREPDVIESRKVGRSATEQAPAIKPPTSAPDVNASPVLAALQGEWVVVSEDWKGKPVANADIQQQSKTLTFVRDKLTFARQGGGKVFTSAGTIRVAEESIDFTGMDYFGQPREFRGIFELSGNTLRLAYPNTNAGLIRPTAFSSSAEGDTLVIVAHRKVVDNRDRLVDVAPTHTGGGVKPPQEVQRERPRGPKILRHDTVAWNKSKTNFARYQDNVLDVGLGNETPGWGHGHSGVEIENVRRLKLAVTFSGKFKYMDVNSFAGFLVDYGTPGGYVKRVGLHTGVFDKKGYAIWARWGKGRLPDEYDGVGTHGTYDLDLKKWAPPDWDGRVWFTTAVSNTGNGTRIVARITSME